MILSYFTHHKSNDNNDSKCNWNKEEGEAPDHDLILLVHGDAVIYFLFIRSAATPKGSACTPLGPISQTSRQRLRKWPYYLSFISEK